MSIMRSFVEIKGCNQVSVKAKMSNLLVSRSVVNKSSFRTRL